VSLTHSMQLLDFADQMAEVLRRHPLAPWKGEKPVWLIGRLLQEVGALQQAVLDDAPPSDVLERAAEVACFALMTADCYGCLGTERS